MKKFWFMCALMALASSAFPVRAEESVTGEWKGSFTGAYGTSQRNYDCYLVLKQDGEKVTGTWSNPTNKVTDRPVAGTFKEGELKMGQWLTTTVTGNTMSGKLLFSNRLVDFTATRTK